MVFRRFREILENILGQVLELIVLKMIQKNFQEVGLILGGMTLGVL
jgi:hypothetical protein